MIKRKRERFDDSDDEEPLSGRQILPVADLPYDFDQVPVDGMQYLFTVRRDARQLPHVTRVANPYQSKEPSPDGPLRKSKHPGLPSDEWRALFEKRFKNFHANVLEATSRVDCPPLVSQGPLMPEMRERACWWAFIEGKPESDWNPPKASRRKKNTQYQGRYRREMRGFWDDTDSEPRENHPPQETWHINDEGEVELALRIDPSESLPTPSGTPIPLDGFDHGPPDENEHQEPANPIRREPTPSLMKYVDHRMSLHLLMYFTHWINVHLKQPEVESSRMTETHARWIFALLSRVESYVSADDMSLLRNLARASLALLKRLIQMRSDAQDGDVDVKRMGPMSECSCWMIVCAIVGVWGQRDLWVDAEAMLFSI